MKHNPAASAKSPRDETVCQSVATPGRCQPEKTVPTELAPAEWEALGSTRELTGSGQMDTENAQEPAPQGEDSARLEGQNKKVIKTLGDYQLLRKLGDGAMGVVYKARQIPTGREVAVKVLFKHIAKNPKLVERFNREARASNSLDHPNVVQGFGVDEEQGFHYFVMEYVDGESLQKVLNRLGKLRWATPCTWSCAVPPACSTPTTTRSFTGTSSPTTSWSRGKAR